MNKIAFVLWLLGFPLILALRAALFAFADRMNGDFYNLLKSDEQDDSVAYMWFYAIIAILLWIFC